MKNVNLLMGLVGGLFISGSASATMVVPGWAGSADPATEAGCWIQDGGKLRMSSSCSSAFHLFSVPLPIKLSTGAAGQTVQISWTHKQDCVSTPPCISFGQTAARPVMLTADGLVSGAPSFNSTEGTTVTSGSFLIPSGGTVQLQVRMTGGSGGNTHYISRVWTTGTLSL